MARGGGGRLNEGMERGNDKGRGAKHVREGGGVKDSERGGL